MNRRLALLLVAGGSLLALLLAWPSVSEQLTIADVTMAAISQPREEVLVSGFIKNRDAPAFSLETLLDRGARQRALSPQSVARRG